MKDLKKHLIKIYEIDLGLLDRPKGMLNLSQKICIEEVLKGFNMDNS